ncbi:efflux RND transporter permease subunit [Saccharospirillum salsuginis]|uniref:Membrane protein n=1 Tax=Saccharospirillum salsuginis TaxID=418750 RepID=A0A918KNV9_9GAMM|nr:MMPL family transporter [Saccharospirillum salsuginis]GGX70069.1 membrane protein [Saccharospirillum salsuginis]
MRQQLLSLYEQAITRHAIWVIVGLALLVLLLGYQARNFTLDASAESLLLEGDDDLEYFRTISERYGSQEFLVLTFTPEEPLFSEPSLDHLSNLRDDIRGIEGVESVVSVMDVPLLSNPPVPMSELVSNIKTLEDPAADVEMARTELANSPLYVNLLLNLSENTTALQINLPRDEEKARLLELREELETQRQNQSPEFEPEALERIDEQIRLQNALRADRVHEVIEAVRDITRDYQAYGELHLGGVPMIADDIISFVRNDLITFGISVFLLLIATLTVIFRKPRWVAVPLLCCGVVVVSMLGILGWGGWPVTVISSNFISLLLILTLSMSIHLIVRYRELLRKHDDWDQRRLVTMAVRRIAVPCLYMALTTGVAFISLMFSGIRPVINFGWMMALGIVCAFIITFTLFPSVLMVLGKDRRTAESKSGGFTTRWFARVTLRSGNWILVASLALAGFTIIGITRLVVENSFIDYFDESTEIYQGMTVIDQRLGGTTPLEVLINFPGPSPVDRSSGETGQPEADTESSDASGGDPFMEEGGSDGFVEEDFLSMESDNVGRFQDDFNVEDDPKKYWFTGDKIEQIKKLHQYLDRQPETGKVLSLATMVEIAEGFNDGQPMTNVQLALLYSVIPKEFRDIVIEPYVSVEHNQARINVRMIDSLDDLDRDAFLERVREDAVEELGFEPGQIKLTGMMVLYNNMLQSLFGSQIMTLGAVFLGILGMFMLLFRSLKLSLIAMAPNLLAATFVLGIMGWFGIPLDMMTITIASITIGIAVDNTIHYIVRFRREIQRDGHYIKALNRSHNSIGKAMFYTSITIILGFGILMLSNFRPTLYFGLLTALAMAVALIGALTLLPRLIVLFKPFGHVVVDGRRDE